MSATGQKVGTRKVINNASASRDEDNQIVAVDPLGRFVVFTIPGDNFFCINNDILAYQALAADGSKKGAIKILADCNFVQDDILNIDILKK
jgi:hypothetical protein